MTKDEVTALRGALQHALYMRAGHALDRFPSALLPDEMLKRAFELFEMARRLDQEPW